MPPARWDPLHSVQTHRLFYRKEISILNPFHRVPGKIKSSSAAGNQPLERLPDVLDLHDVADLLRVHQKTVRLMAIDGKIPAFRAGRLWRFKKTRIEEFLNVTICV
jgi:excisionase family DNA binding protein